MSSGNILLQSSVDMNDPREHVAWALNGLAGPNSHAPLIVPKRTQGDWSETLYEAGFRHHPELQQIKYVPPAKDTNWVMGAAGRWVPITEELPAEVTAPDVSHLSRDEQLALLADLNSRFAPAVAEDAREAAEVTHG